MDHIIANIADFRYLCNIMFKKLWHLFKYPFRICCSTYNCFGLKRLRCSSFMNHRCIWGLRTFFINVYTPQRFIFYRVIGSR